MIHVNDKHMLNFWYQISIKYLPRCLIYMSCKAFMRWNVQHFTPYDTKLRILRLHLVYTVPSYYKEPELNL